ncbi:type I pullulanase [[Mycoplasma] testudinis]|uniref:type I pullulanase n=1 Tax=[Mycoplasma] testudinis TaxID=33924 RepID=UPI0006985241|nr:type I pullulanase [[Mycoplasma] testudinis]
MRTIPIAFKDETTSCIECFYDNWDLITVNAPKNRYKKEDSFWLFDVNENLTHQANVLMIESQETEDFVKLKVPRNVFFLRHQYYIIDKELTRLPVKMGSLVFRPDFDSSIYYGKNDLGYHYSKESTCFKIYAPLALAVELLVYDPYSKELLETFQLIDNEEGTFSIRLDRDCEGMMYRYVIHSNHTTHETTDPYAFSSSANSEFSYVINLEKTRSAMKFDRPKNRIVDYPDAVVYELNIRDFTDSAFFKHRGKFLGMTETGLTDQNGNKIGLDYLTDLNVTHVQILPFYDFKTLDELHYPKGLEYNWGYDPIQFNVPEGAYASDANDPYNRIIELKRMISTLHEKNIAVVMDVVYNHVYDVNSFAWQKILPGYFFRFDGRGFFSNATGVGNDIASERLMVRKYIVDMCRYWIEEFKLDGFRFDLMGILDVQTMNAIVEMARAINPSFIIYGEGWNMPSATDQPLANMQNHNELKKIGFFNDYFRDAIRGSQWDKAQGGFVSGNLGFFNQAANAMMASLGLNMFHNIFNEPWQSVNYIEAHDNQTFYDYLKDRLPTFNPSSIQKMALLGLGIVMLSQGIPFIHAGQEIYRTKFGEDNTYNKPISYNRFDWNQINEYQREIEFFKKLVDIRKDNYLFRLRTKEEIAKYTHVIHEKNSLVTYCLSDDKDIFHVVINTSSTPQTTVKEYHDFICVTNNHFHNPSIDVNKNVEILAYGFYVFYKRN